MKHRTLVAAPFARETSQKCPGLCRIDRGVRVQTALTAYRFPQNRENGFLLAPLLDLLESVLVFIVADLTPLLHRFGAILFRPPSLEVLDHFSNSFRDFAPASFHASPSSQLARRCAISLLACCFIYFVAYTVPSTEARAPDDWLRRLQHAACVLTN